MNDQERRSYFRTDDKISLRYKILEHDNYKGDVEDATVGFIIQNDLRHLSHNIDIRLEVIINNLEEKNPQVAEALQLITKQIAILKSLSSEASEWTECSDLRQTVNLSGGGIAFYTEHEIMLDTPLKMEITMYPSNHFIPVLGRVVSCRENGDKEVTGSYVVATEFEGISEEDREHIIQHIITKQSAELKKIRQDDM